MGKTINLSQMHDLIDLYKYASIEGEKVEFIVYPTKDNKRVVTIGLQNGFSRDRDTFVFEDGDKFDKEIYPDLLSYFSHNDSLGNWDITVPEHEEATVKGSSETTSGNLVYLDTYNKELFNEIKEKVEVVEDETTYKKENLTNEDKIWDEIILYAKERRVLLDFYKGNNLTKEEVKKVYEFISNLAKNVKDINYGKSKKAKNNNEIYLKNLFDKKDELLKYGLDEDLINKLNNVSTIKKLAHLVGIEKRVSKRLDLDNKEINNKIDFATSELEKVEFFNLKNADIKQFTNNDFIESKPKELQELIEIYNKDGSYYEEVKEQYTEYCYELMEYLKRKSKENKKIVKSNIDSESIVFQESDDKTVDNYDELRESIELIKGAKLDSERYEIIVDTRGEKVDVRIDLLDGPTRSDIYEFEFHDKDVFDVEINKILDAIYEEDPKLESTIVYVDKLGKGKTKVKLDETKNNNEILIKGDEIDHMEKRVTVEDLEKLSSEINDYLFEQEKVQENTKTEVKKKETYDIDLASYEILVDKYKGSLDEKFHNSELLKDEYQIVQKIYKARNSFEDYYNDNYDNIDNIDKDGVEKIADAELYLSTIYQIDAKYKDNKKRIEDLEGQEDLIPAGRLLLKVLKGLDKTDKNINFIDDIVDMNINVYKEISDKYNGNIDNPNRLETLSDKEDLKKIINYKLNLIDSYNALLLKQDELTDDEIRRVAEYETRLNKINEIDAKYINNVDVLIKELKENEKFLLPSTKIWLSAIEHKKGKDNGIDNDKREELEELKNSLFEIINSQFDEKEDEVITEIKDAYDKALSYEGDETPASIKIEFEKDNKEEADVVISNKINNQDVTIYRRTFDINKLNKTIMPTLRELYTKDNEVNYNIKFNVSGTSDYCLLLVGKERKVFNIVNAKEEFVDENKEELENLLNSKKK